MPLASCFSPNRRGFSLLETLTALGILALICTGVVTVMNRCTEAAMNLTLETQAFEVARAQMEQVLAQVSVSESVDLGTSELYPGIEWRTTVETFEEPVNGDEWARAVCIAEYADADGQTQTVELTCWLARLTQEQVAQLGQEKTQDANDQILGSVEAAADYAGVTTETIQAWVDNGMVVTEQLTFIKVNLDLYKRAGGRPSDKDKQQQIHSPEELASLNRDGAPDQESQNTRGTMKDNHASR